MYAAFPMYDRPETAQALDRFWEILRAALLERGVGVALQRSQPNDLLAFWRSPEMVISQSCAYPLRAKLRDHITVLGAADHGLDGVAAGQYSSVIVAHSELAPAALPQHLMAINDPISQSGWAAPFMWLVEAGLAPPRKVVVSGSHRNSAEMVAKGLADWAALDVVSWRMMRRYDGFARKLKVIAHTVASNALPFITARGRDPQPLREALSVAMLQLTPEDQDQLSIFGFVSKDITDYLAEAARFSAVLDPACAEVESI